MEGSIGIVVTSDYPNHFRHMGDTVLKKQTYSLNKTIYYNLLGEDGSPKLLEGFYTFFTPSMPPIGFGYVYISQIVYYNTSRLIIPTQ